MKRKSLILLPILSILVISGCGKKINYADRTDFSNEQEKERKELYKDVLSSVGVDSVDKFALMYIDYIMTKSDRFKTLEKMNPTDDFSDFFLQAIPILYFSYSPKTYKNVPREWKDKTKKYILEQTPYYLNSGEEKFRKALEKQLKNESWYVFPFYNDKEPEEKANGANDNKNNANLVAALVWLEDFTFSDFKSLNKTSQALLVRLKAIMNYINNGNKIDDDSREIFDKIETRWEKRSDDFLSSPQFSTLPDDTPYSEISQLAIKVVIASFN